MQNMPEPQETTGAPRWDDWSKISRGKKGLLPGFINGCGILFFLFGLWLASVAENVLVSFVAVPIGAFVWLLLGGISSLIRSLRTIETYEANSYKLLRSMYEEE